MSSSTQWRVVSVEACPARVSIVGIGDAELVEGGAALYEVNELGTHLLELIDEVFELKPRLLAGILADHGPARGDEPTT